MDYAQLRADAWARQDREDELRRKAERAAREATRPGHTSAHYRHREAASAAAARAEARSRGAVEPDVMAISDEDVAEMRRAHLIEEITAYTRREATEARVRMFFNELVGPYGFRVVLKAHHKFAMPAWGRQ